VSQQPDQWIKSLPEYRLFNTSICDCTYHPACPSSTSTYLSIPKVSGRLRVNIRGSPCLNHKVLVPRYPDTFGMRKYLARVYSCPTTSTGSLLRPPTCPVWYPYLGNCSQKEEEECSPTKAHHGGQTHSSCHRPGIEEGHYQKEEERYYEVGWYSLLHQYHRTL